MNVTLASEYAAAPYPGARPTFSYLLDQERVHRTTRRADGTWAFAADLNSGVSEWLVARGLLPVEGRTPLLSYGSNACPGKLQDMRRLFRLEGPVVMTPCAVVGAAAVLCASMRSDGAVPATLAPYPGIEQHFLWWVAPEQWSALDACEGRSARYYDLVDVPAPVLDERGQAIPEVVTYVGARAERRPSLDKFGQPTLLTPRPEAA